MAEFITAGRERWPIFSRFLPTKPKPKFNDVAIINAASLLGKIL